MTKYLKRINQLHASSKNQIKLQAKPKKYYYNYRDIIYSNVYLTKLILVPSPKREC